MVSEVNPGEESAKGPVRGLKRETFAGLTITQFEPYLFRVCCDVMGLDPTGQTYGYFIVHDGGLTHIDHGREGITIPWHLPSKG